MNSEHTNRTVYLHVLFTLCEMQHSEYHFNHNNTHLPQPLPTTYHCLLDSQHKCTDHSQQLLSGRLASTYTSVPLCSVKQHEAYCIALTHLRLWNERSIYVLLLVVAGHHRVQRISRKFNSGSTKGPGGLSASRSWKVLSIPSFLLTQMAILTGEH